MSKPQLITSQGQGIIGELFGYVPAVLKEYKEFWCIEYYVKNPITHEFQRKREKVTCYINRYGKMQARSYLRVVINQLNLKLSQGWSPFFVQEDSRLYERITEVTEKFISERSRDLRPDTIRSYKSSINEFLRFTKENYPTITASTFNHNIAVRYMDYILSKGNSIQITTMYVR